MGQMDVLERNLEILRRATLLMPGLLPKACGGHRIDLMNAGHRIRFVHTPKHNSQINR